MYILISYLTSGFYGDFDNFDDEYIKSQLHWERYGTKSEAIAAAACREATEGSGYKYYVIWTSGNNQLFEANVKDDFADEFRERLAEHELTKKVEAEERALYERLKLKYEKPKS